MKKFVKLSLAAAVAVAGLSTSASAAGLEEAIKGVTISGKMEVEYDYTSTQSTGGEKGTTNGWDYDWDVTAKIPVNDQITAVFGMEGDNGVDKATDLNTKIDDDNVNVTKTYFQYANGPVTALVGKQGKAGAPWFDDERANGVVGLYNAGVATVAAAHFTGTNAPLLANQDISAAAVIGSVGPVNAQVWYADITDVADSYVVMANAKFEMINVDVKYGQADYELATLNAVAGLRTDGSDTDAEMMQAVVSASLDGFTPYVGYGATDTYQAGAGLDLTGDTDSAIDFGSEQLSIDDLHNASAYIVGVTVPFGAATVNMSYVDGEYDYATSTTGDFDEFLLEVDYKMSKNFNIGAHYSTAELQTAANSTDETDSISASLEYKF